MRAYVGFEVITARERRVTEHAFEVLLTGVQLYVTIETASVLEALAADLANEHVVGRVVLGRLGRVF